VGGTGFNGKRPFAGSSKEVGWGGGVRYEGIERGTMRDCSRGRKKVRPGKRWTGGARAPDWLSIPPRKSGKKKYEGSKITDGFETQEDGKLRQESGGKCPKQGCKGRPVSMIS